jgi:hypothetical protein
MSVTDINPALTGVISPKIVGFRVPEPQTLNDCNDVEALQAIANIDIPLLVEKSVQKSKLIYGWARLNMM